MTDEALWALCRKTAIDLYYLDRLLHADRLIMFAREIQQAERERCASIARRYIRNPEQDDNWQNDDALEIANTILQEPT